MDNSKIIRHAALMVRNIAAGEWTNVPPSWADYHRIVVFSGEMEPDEAYTRAVQTAEAFILLFMRFDPTFNEQAFLRACKLR